MSKSRTMQRAAEREHDDGKVRRVTSRGVSVICLPIVTQIEQVTQNYKMPTPPTYTVESGGPGAKDEVTVTYTEDVVKLLGDNMPEQDKAAWAAYKAQLAIAIRERNEMSTRVIATDGVIIPEMDIDKSWEDKARWQGAVVPETPWERQYFYFINYAIGNVRDVEEIMLGIYEASGLDKEVLSRIEDSFRRPLDERGRPDADADQEPAQAPG